MSFHFIFFFSFHFISFSFHFISLFSFHFISFSFSFSFHFISFHLFLIHSFVHSITQFSSIQLNSIQFGPVQFNSIQFNSFSSIHSFQLTSFQLTDNSYKQIGSYSHVLFLKLRPRRVPGTTWYIFIVCCQYIAWSEIVFLLSIHELFPLEMQLKLIETTHNKKKTTTEKHCSFRDCVILRINLDYIIQTKSDSSCFIGSICLSNLSFTTHYLKNVCMINMRGILWRCAILTGETFVDVQFFFGEWNISFHSMAFFFRQNIFLKQYRIIFKKHVLLSKKGQLKHLFCEWFFLQMKCDAFPKENARTFPKKTHFFS
jgi:hypothetical protein